MDNFKTVNNDLDNLVGVDSMQIDIFDKVFGVDKKTGDIWVMTSHSNDEMVNLIAENRELKEQLEAANNILKLYRR